MLRAVFRDGPCLTDHEGAARIVMTLDGRTRTHRTAELVREDVTQLIE
jgi:hypothetical protein